MLAIKKVECVSQLIHLKSFYFQSATSPLDGMWHFGFVPMATHFGFYVDNQLIGFCCINDDGYLLQFYVATNTETTAQELFTSIAKHKSAPIGHIKGAFVSTAEPQYLSLCLDNATVFDVNALMYQLDPKAMRQDAEPLPMVMATEHQLAQFVQFAAVNIGAPQAWLNSYYGNLIARQELFGYWVEGQLIASGECRKFDEHQQEYADLGMIVAQSMRGKGLAQRVLHYLKDYCARQGLKPMCSTERGNVAAQKAITNAGFISIHRIVKFELCPE